jgi:hypothetical protein
MRETGKSKAVRRAIRRVSESPVTSLSDVARDDKRPQILQILS